MSNKSRIGQIRSLLEASFAPSRLEIEDDSWKHAGHAGAAGHGGGHFSIVIAADAFSGRSRLQRHRMVMQVLQPMFRDEIHALSIRAEAPGE
ncbi:MAG TPA: BolA family protein [Mariprofundaceae bacterium]|nr:BolA family protein [Mariprofundaceae bacterium]